MERYAYELMRKTENSWWYRGRTLVASAIWHRYAHRRGDVLDYGAGNGALGEAFKRFGTVYGFEPDTEARSIAQGRGYVEIFADEAHALERSYTTVAFFDVLEHLADDHATLERVRDALLPGGYVLLNVPAYQWLWSVHDVTHHHYRRYSRSQVRKLLKDAGYDAMFVSYWVFFLFPAAMVMRLLGKTGESAVHLPKPLNSLLFLLIEIESVLMRFFPLPFGNSVVAIGRKR